MTQKLILFAFLFTIASAMYAKKVTLKAGTVVRLESINEVRASKTHIGEPVKFKVSQDIKVEGNVVIPIGTIANGTVYEAKRSTCFGTKGRLGIKLNNLTLPSGDIINFTSSEIYIQGKNRTPVSVVVFCLTYLPFPCGSKAVMPIGYECEGTIAANTEIEVK